MFGKVCLMRLFCADSINILKSCLDKVWCNQDLKFDWEAEILGIGSRSFKFI